MFLRLWWHCQAACGTSDSFHRSMLDNLFPSVSWSYFEPTTPTANMSHHLHSHCSHFRHNQSFAVRSRLSSDFHGCPNRLQSFRLHCTHNRPHNHPANELDAKHFRLACEQNIMFSPKQKQNNNNHIKSSLGVRCRPAIISQINVQSVIQLTLALTNRLSMEWNSNFDAAMLACNTLDIGWNRCCRWKRI